MTSIQSRRRFLATASLAGASFAGTAGLIGVPRLAHAEPPPETTTVRLAKLASICVAPQHIAGGLLHAEGFTDVHYVVAESGADQMKKLTGGELDFCMNFSPPAITSLDAGDPITVVAGVHVGCFELFGTDRIHRIADLKGKSLGVQGFGTSQHLFLAGMVAYVGLDAVRDINWVTTGSVKPMELFTEGKIDAFLGLPPEPQELRAWKIGHVIVNSAIDRPWSQYFCCMLIGNRDLIHAHPIATKRVLRTILKAADLCVTEPKRVAQRLVDGGFTDRYDYALEALIEIPYDKWRAYDPEDTIRFYALRLHELGMIKSTPQKIIAGGTDWRFLNESKHELKG
jgi:NitT/TauT family transport system substrate-binding protein